MNYIWKRLSKEDVDRIADKYKLTYEERQIMMLRRKGITVISISDKVGYDERHIRRLSNQILKKIKDEL